MIRSRIVELIRGLTRQETDPEAVQALKRRVAALLPLWQEARDLARLTAHYYDYDKGGSPMNQISLDAKGGQFLADLSNWQRESAPDNSADLERLRRNLRFARQQVLTKRQQQMLELYYDQGLTMGQIAAKLHLNRSTVCRTLQRARERLYACLRYTL